jgi:hypothetical protein
LAVEDSVEAKLQREADQLKSLLATLKSDGRSPGSGRAQLGFD